MTAKHKSASTSVATIKKKYGADFYAKVGAMGGSAYHSKPQGLAALSPEKRKEIAIKGGKAQKRGKAYRDS